MSVANSAEVIKTQRLFSSRSYDSSNEENDSVDSICSGEGDSESDYDQNSDEEDCFCVASDTERCGLDDEIDSLDGDDLYAVHVGVETADPLCVKLNDLIKRGKIPKERILYRYLNDVVEIMYNPFHKYDPEVVEFFNTITYLGGKRTANFIRGPMNVGDGGHSHLNHEQDKKKQPGWTIRTTYSKVPSRTHSGIRCHQAAILRTYRSNVNGRILQVIWLGNEVGSETGDHLGCKLPHKQAILVPKPEG